MPKASCVVVFLPLSTAKAMELRLLGVARKHCRTSSPPRRSSQSIITASNFSEMRISPACFASWQTSTVMDSFSSVGRNTRTTEASPLTRRDSNVML